MKREYDENVNKKIPIYKIFTGFIFLFIFGLLFLFPNGFVFAEDLAPKITSLNPSIIDVYDPLKTGGEFDIIGSGFGQDSPNYCGTEVCGMQKGSIVVIAGTNTGLPILSWSDTTIHVRFPYGGYNGYVPIQVGARDQSGNLVYSNSFPITISCISDSYLCDGDGWSVCSADGLQTRTCKKTFDCPLVDSPWPEMSRSCTPPPSSCTSDTWSCGDWNTCSAYGQQTRTCAKTFECPSINTPSPATSQSCTPPPVYKPPQPQQPTCDADTWICGDWNSCSLSGVQSRSCRKTFDCPNIQTAPPITDQYCEPPNRPTPQTPPSGTDEILNQDTIIKSTVKLICPVDAQRASQGSGTVIDSNGTILTNKHVISGTLGCLVGFINGFNDEPYFGERQIADVLKVSPNDDVAILRIRNPQNRTLTSVDITKGNSNLRLGAKVIIYGYPAKFGTKITYTSGDFSGTDGNYLKTTAILEYGNSGGGAYLKDGTFIGIPSAVVKGELNALGYILSINTINAW